REFGDRPARRGIDDLMQAASGDHRGTVDPAACHAGGDGIGLNNSHGPTLADRNYRGYAFPQREVVQTKEFMVMVACHDGFRAQSHAWPTRVHRMAWRPPHSA